MLSVVVLFRFPSNRNRPLLGACITFVQVGHEGDFYFRQIDRVIKIQIFDTYVLSSHLMQHFIECERSFFVLIKPI